MSLNNSNNDETVVKGIELRADTLIHGLQTALPAGVTQLIVGGVSYPVADLVKLAQELVKPWKDVRAAHVAVRKFGQDRPAAEQKLTAFLADAKIAVMGLLGRENQALTSFGIKPQKRVCNDAGNARTRTVRIEVGVGHRNRRNRS